MRNGTPLIRWLVALRLFGQRLTEEQQEQIMDFIPQYRTPSRLEVAKTGEEKLRAPRPRECELLV
jgi:hypothetical protein